MCKLPYANKLSETHTKRAIQNKKKKVKPFSLLLLLLTNLETQAQIDKNTVPGSRSLHLLGITTRIIFLTKKSSISPKGKN